MTVKPRKPWPVRVMLLLWLAAILSGCASRPVVLEPLKTPPPAAAMTDDSASSLDYSQRARDWLKKAADELSNWQQKNPPCSVTQPKKGNCT